jgi:hypothetical protein
VVQYEYDDKFMHKSIESVGISSSRKDLCNGVCLEILGREIQPRFLVENNGERDDKREQSAPQAVPETTHLSSWFITHRASKKC